MASSSYGYPEVEAPYRSTSQTNPATQEWNPPSSSADEALLPSLGTLRDQCRQLDRNESLARGAIENYTTNVIGDGLRPQARIDHELAGITEPDARAFERRAEKVFEMHMGKAAADFHGQSTLQEIEQQAFRSTMLDGDCLVIRRYRDRPGVILPVCLQLIDGARIQNPSFGSAREVEIREGVEFDKAGVPVAYHVETTPRGIGIGPGTVRVPRFDDEGNQVALHVFRKRLPGQSRGEPFLAPVVQKFKQLTDYSEAEILAAAINACYTTFITTETPDVAARQKSAIPEALRPPQKRHTEKFGPGIMMELLPNEKVDRSAPGRPNPNFDPFVQAVIKQIGIGLGLPYEVYTQHFQSSYSAARGAILEAWKSFKVWRSWFIEAFCRPVWEWVITDAVREGLLEAPGFDDPLARQAYLATQWTGTEMESIDPLKESKSNECDIKNGIRSRRSIIESQGRDFDKHVREYTAEADIFKIQSKAQPLSVAQEQGNGNTTRKGKV
ncbi:MAG TPA: phage portal protein [Oligoflexus sp.]|uniref:phage portal protein n=1 Tax=Oligoflexus sp. TaxID=1971216 RepID=UPI002D60E61E|nr:phage portal protein [Oligoflexus sp.]HYX37114.1 phage portal protein [Oligoflexus sp.]